MNPTALPIMSVPATAASGGDAPTYAWYRDDPKDWHVVHIDARTFLYVADGSRIYEVDSETATQLERLSPRGEAAAQLFLSTLGIRPLHRISDEAPEQPPLRSLSLAVAQQCNLGCTYCYAQQGSFGGAPKPMPLTTALLAVEALFAEVVPGERVHLAFMGGEPLLNRPVILAATQYATQLAQRKGATVGFAITTNGTLLTLADGEFFEQHGFAVTLSLDGVGATHDRQRMFKSGRGSYERILDNVGPLLSMQQRMQVSARVTVTPSNLELPHTLKALIALGFHSVGFSPMLASPTGEAQMDGAALEIMLDQMIACGHEFERHVVADERFAFANMVTAMKEIHQGTHRPYPCGAGAGYFGVSADGELFACHRFVDDASGLMGNLKTGVDRQTQAHWLRQRHVHRQEPCRSCWARYLCGGGCHHEVIHRGRPACDYIRGWLHYCLQAYGRLLECRPDYFL